MAEAEASYPSLRGSGTVVTGGATGIGRAIAEAFARQGARVAVLDTDAESGARLADESGGMITFLECDVTDAAGLRAAVDTAAERFDRLDTVIANAADDTRHDPSDLTPELWDSALRLNLSHQFFLAQAAEPHLRAVGGGSIVCIGSIAWLNGTTGMVAYTAAKAGVEGLVKTLGRTWGDAGIRVNSLLPGWTMTERQRELWVDADAERQIDDEQSLPGRVMPGDIASAALFLASDEARMISRQSLIVDGGWV